MSYTILGPLQQHGVPLPLYSHQVSAGFPSPAADHLEKHISLDELFEIRAPHVYLVKIKGDSMIGAGIYSGDLVIVDRSREAQHGDIVIAALNSEPVCKRLHRKGPNVILQSENSAFPARFIRSSVIGCCAIPLSKWKLWGSSRVAWPMTSTTCWPASLAAWR